MTIDPQPQAGQALRYVSLRSLERVLGEPAELHRHFKTNGTDGRLTQVNVSFWPCGCRALVFDSDLTPYRPCPQHLGPTA